MSEKRKIKYCALGDSITYGFIPRNYPGYPGQLKSYAALAAQKLEKLSGSKVEFCNFGISDSTIANLPENTPMCIRYAEMPDDADIITVMGGTNDVRCGVPLGKMSDRCNTTFYGALHTLLQGLYTKYIGDAEPSVGAKRKIVILTPIKLLDAEKSHLPNTPGNNAEALFKWESWINAIKEVAAFYSLPVLDMHNLSGINPHLNRTIKGFEDGYFGNYNPYITDGTHPTQEGAEMMAQALTKMLV
ncbi:MAG: SGNH/GDSL hydrolase family protein [Bacteroidales bacterium]|nr:SGNH/GDSL hydrolase family protein [Bacteroidales bacterium]